VNAAVRPSGRGGRLLHLDPTAGRIHDAQLAELPSLLLRDDLVVVNDAATLPASLQAVAESGEPVEVRLLGETGSSGWRAVLFGPGDWHVRTEDRPAPPLLGPGAALSFGDGLRALIGGVSSLSPRLVVLTFGMEGAALWSALYRLGKPVQYAHLEAGLALSDVQTVYATRPWAAELPSAGRPLSGDVLLGLKRRGIALAAITHAAGLSSTGDPELDRALPLPERYDVPSATVVAVRRARSAGGRVVAVGTSVVRALEGCALRNGGALWPGEGTTGLVIGPGFRPRVVDGLLTGFHEPGSSHLGLLRAFAPPLLLESAYTHAEAAGYRGHEFGDSSLILEAA
jgi:S-adenosylmethionine:tRNA ribosyltransferase-isomerase